MLRKRRISITRKLLYVLIPLLSVLVSFIIITCFINIKEIMTDAVMNQIENEAKYNAQEIIIWRTGITEMLEAVQGTLEYVNFPSDEEELRYLEKTVDYSESIPYGVYEGDADGIYLDGSGWVPDADYVVTERDWYKDGLSCSEFTFGTPYIDANTGYFIVSASTLLNRKDKNKRVAAVDIFLDDITNLVSEIKVMNAKSGYAFLVDTSVNTVLAHADLSQNGREMSVNDSDTFMAQITKLLDATEFEIHSVDNNGLAYYVALLPIKNTKWTLVSCVEEKEAYSELRRLEVMYGFFSVIVIVITGTVIGFIIHKTTSPIQILTENISSISDGDFTIEVKERGNDEITTMSIALRDYIKRMREVIGDIRNISTRLDEKANLGSETAKLLNTAANEQSESMKSMKSTMDELANAVNEIANNATTLAQVVEDTNSHVSDANDKMQTSVSVADEGYKNMKTVQENMQQIVVSIEELASVVENVGQSTGEINEIIQMIGEIAASTNLLALNASIEAARAGEAGKGFAVVADEISKLASSSANSVDQIADIIHKVNGQVDIMVSKTKGNVEVIENNSELLDVAYEGFHSIYNDIAETSKIMNSIMGEVRQVNDVASNMAAISEEQSASAELVTETINQIFKQSEHVADESGRVEETSEVLSEVSKSLMESMNEFKITSE